METKREQIPYTGENYIKLHGQGSKLSQIMDEYKSHIADGYNYTVEEICNYLSCTSTYFLKEYRDSIKHIRVTDLIRTTAKEMMIENELDPGYYYNYFMKRILYNREDFRQFILNNVKAKYYYKRLVLTDFNIIPDSLNHEIKLINYLNDKSESCYGIPENPIIKPLRYVPDRLYSQKDIKQIKGLKYNVEFYRWIKSAGIKKLKLESDYIDKKGEAKHTEIVRYDIEDFSGNYILVNYAAWEQYGSKEIIKQLKAFL